MFLNVCKVKHGNKVYAYLRIIESYCHKGKIKKRLIANLGQLALINKESLSRLGASLIEYSGRRIPSLEKLEAISTLHYGEVIATKAIWDSLGLETILSSCLTKRRKMDFDYCLCVFVMLVNRLIAPKSKLAITRWQERLYLEEAPKPKYQHYLRTLDYLARTKEEIEKSLFSRLTDLFSLKLNLIFYDLTSTYFEGQSCPLAEFGYSRDHRPDARQIVLGLLVTDEGLPIAHQIYNGNISDKSTLRETIDILKKRFQIKRCIFVGDRGLVSEENLNYLTLQDYSFIVALRKRNSNEVKEILKTASSNYTIVNDILRFKEIISKDIRYLICKNPQKEENDRIFRDNLIKNVSGELKRASRKQSAQSKLKSAAELLAIKKAKRYFTIGIDRENNFFWRLNEESICYEKELDGVYILKTNVQDLKPFEVVKAYKNLCEVEDAFREIKDFLKLRPIYHYSPTRVKGHVMLCVLAYLIEKVLAKSLKGAHLNLTPREALEHLDTLRLVENKIAGQRLLCVTTPSKEHRSILKSVNIKILPRILKA